MDENPYTAPRAESQRIRRPKLASRGSILRHAVWWMLGSAVVVGGYGSILLGDKNLMGFVFVFLSPFVGLVLCLIYNASLGRDNEHNPDANASVYRIES